MGPETKICQNCQKDFVIEPEDFGFYEKIKVPPPTFCFSCRLQRRLSWRNERGLHKRTCDLCSRNIISMHSTRAPFPVYCSNCWYSDQWDSLSYGRDYDFSRSFFTQFKELQNSVPHIALQVDDCVNCDYANQIANCKNCYLIVGGSDNQDCLYDYRILNSKNVVDCLISMNNEWVYDSLDVRGSSRVICSEECSDSIDLTFCLDVRNSQNCFMSANLRKARYIFRGEQLSKEMYLQKIKEINFGSYATVVNLRKEFAGLRLRSLHKFAATKNVENCSGYSISDSHHSQWCFNAAKLENCKYAYMVNNTRDSMDVNNHCCQAELCYEVNTGGVNSSYNRMSSDVWPESRNMTYCETCRNGAADLFGCVSLRGRQYGILNKIYDQSTYQDLVSRIIQHMNDMPFIDSLGRVYKYGEFFPIELSPFPYNDSAAQDYYPLEESRVRVNKYPWQETSARVLIEAIPPVQLPDDIGNVSDDLLGQVIRCSHDGKCSERCTLGFKIVPEELSFYRRMNLPIPRICYNCRLTEQFSRRNPLCLFQRKCMCSSQFLGKISGAHQNTAQHFHGTEPCPNEFETTYSPERPEIVYCEACYNSEVA